MWHCAWGILGSFQGGLIVIWVSLPSGKNLCHIWGIHKQSGWNWHRGISWSAHLEAAAVGNIYCRRDRQMASLRYGYVCELSYDVPGRQGKQTGLATDNFLVSGIIYCVCLVTQSVWVFVTSWTVACRTLEWVAISSSKASSWPRDWTSISCIAGKFFPAEPLGKTHY